MRVRPRTFVRPGYGKYLLINQFDRNWIGSVLLSFVATFCCQERLIKRAAGERLLKMTAMVNVLPTVIDDFYPQTTQKMLSHCNVFAICTLVVSDFVCDDNILFMCCGPS